MLAPGDLLMNPATDTPPPGPPPLTGEPPTTPPTDAPPVEDSFLLRLLRALGAIHT